MPQSCEVTTRCCKNNCSFFDKFVHGHNVTHMENHCNVGASTIWKYVERACDVLIDRDKLFNNYNKIPSKN